MTDIEEKLPNLKKDVSLSRYTTFHIGGNAKYFIEAGSKEEVERAIIIAKDNDLPFLVLGNGSNILVSDDGYDGLVIKMSGRKIASGGEIVIAESGVLLPSLVLFCAKSGLAGLEWASGIPGTVGGAVRGNAGAFGESMADSIVEVIVIDAGTGKVSTMRNDECEFGYRESLFKRYPELVVVEAKMKFSKDDPEEVQAKANQYLDYRKERHPREPSAGSVFKAPELSDEKRAEMFERFPEIEKLGIIVPAAFLIDKCGLKGKRLGDAMVSDLHANFVINVGEAKAEDVKRLISLIKEKVKEEFGVSLEEEIQYVGF